MERKKFLKSLLTGVLTGPAVMMACSKSSEADTGSVVTNPGNTSSAGCVVSPTETEGPFPTKSPVNYNRSDITDGRTGYKMNAKIQVANINAACSALSGAIVDIWHCDAEGNYSEYGGTGMQSVNYQSLHFLRGRQVTDANGEVNFTTIFPGWYSGRATHIHVHIYTAAGNSLKITQIAFPEGAGSAKALVNGYNKGMSGYTYNANDMVFRDDSTQQEVATVTGSKESGFELSIQINVAA